MCLRRILISFTLMGIAGTVRADVPLQYSNVGISPMGERVAVPIGDVLDILDANSFTIRKQIPVPGSTPYFAAWSPDGKYVAASGYGGYGNSFGQVTVWRTDNWLPVAFIGTGGRPCRPSFLPGTTRLIVSSGDSTVILWDFAKNLVVRRYPVEGRPSIVAVAASGKFIAVGATPTGYVFQTGGRLLRRLPDGLGAVSISPDSRRLLYTTYVGETPPTYEVDLRTGRRRIRPNPNATADMLFYRKDGHSFVAVVQDYPETNAIPDWVKTVVKLAHADASTSKPAVTNAGYLPPLSHWPAGPSTRLSAWTIVPAAPESHAPDLNAFINAKLSRWPVKGSADWIASYQNPTSTDLYLGLPPPAEVGSSTIETGYTVPGQVFDPTLSPDHRYIAYVTAQHIDIGDTVSIRVLDLKSGRLSPIPFDSTYDSRVVWSPNSRYLAVFDGGFDNVKGSTQHALYCWEIDTNKIRSIATAWTLDATWTSSGILKVEAGDAQSGGSALDFYPKSGMISAEENAVKSGQAAL